MSRSKKVLLIIAIIFILIMLYISYDMASRTTFPGAKPNVKENNVPSNAS